MKALDEIKNEIGNAKATSGHILKVGYHFDALSFRHSQFDGLMNPLLMVDHFRMRAPTFGLHRHEGFSAVTYVFEDSRSAHLNHDSLGNDRPIEPGSLHWMAAGRGVMHDEWPGGDDPETHGLQFFVNLPHTLRREAPYAVHVDAKDVPIVEREGTRVRVVSGRHAGLSSPFTPPQSFSFYDAFAREGEQIEFDQLAGPSVWLYVLEGVVEMYHPEPIQVRAGFAVAVALSDQPFLHIQAKKETHFVVMSGDHV
jgi:redox-sensitive bicupin YhaK (pirin superfamily)